MSLAEQRDTVPATTAGPLDRPDTARTFESTDPATGAVKRGPAEQPLAAFPVRVVDGDVLPA